MKIREILIVMALFAVAVIWVGCGSSGSSSDNNDDGGMSESEAMALTEQISNALDCAPRVGRLRGKN